MKIQKHEFIVVCDNIRSTHNVGSIFRTADGAGVSKLYLCGITPVPPRPDIDKVSLGAEKAVPFEYKKSTVSLLIALKKQGYHIIALENKISRSQEYRNYKPAFPLVLVLGSEVSGLVSTVLKKCDDAIFIPMHGMKESLNVSVAFGIVSYHLISSR